MGESDVKPSHYYYYIATTAAEFLRGGIQLFPLFDLITSNGDIEEWSCRT
jgi:hypothetical protein